MGGADRKARRRALHQPGRSKDWLKLKCVWEQEFVIGGFTDPPGSRTDFGALLVGYREDGQLRYAGKVGTGYSTATLRELGAKLGGLEMPRVALRGRAADPTRHSLDPAPAGRARSALPSGRPTVACASRGF